jgi:hypothetical protein
MWINWQQHTEHELSQPLAARLGSWFRGLWKAAATAKGCAERTVATWLPAGLRAKPPGIAAGSGLVLYFCVAVIMHARARAFGVIRVPAAYLGLSPVSFALATRRATGPPTA